MDATTAGTSYAQLNALLDQVNRRVIAPDAVTTEQLLALQHRWVTALSARLDQTLELAGSEPLADAVAQTWRELAAEQPTLRAVLNAAEARSSKLDDALTREFRVLALAAGLVGVDEAALRAAALGRGLRDLIHPGSVSSSLASA